MSPERPKAPSLEQEAHTIAKELVQRLGTHDIPFCFRTANDSIYVSNRHGQTIRYKTAERKYDRLSDITAFLDNQYMDPAVTSRFSETYIPNSLANENGMLAFEDSEDKIDAKIIHSWDNLPTDDIEILKRSLFLIVGEDKKLIKKAPVSLIPSLNSRPLDFGDPQTNQHGHRVHFGNMIENIEITNRKSEAETIKAITDLTTISLKNKRGRK